MEKIKLLTLAVLSLLLLNLGILGFLFFSGPKEHRPPSDHGPESRQKPREIIIEKLHFDNNQQKEYDKLIQRHQVDIRIIEANIRSSKEELYQLLSEKEINIKHKDSLIYALTMCQKQIEITHFKHFEDIKKLCHKDQIADFNNLTMELGRLFSRGRKHPSEHD